MSKRYKRHFLKDKEAKKLLENTSKWLKTPLEKCFAGMPKVEVVKVNFGEVYLLNSEPAFFKSGEKIYPTLLFKEVFGFLPKVVVDMGAVPHVCNGADVMAPGILRFEGEFVKGDIVLVVDEKYGKAIAIGEILYSADEMVKVKHGAVVKNIHYVGDKVWKTIKELAST
jgi:PUA-domain protein